MPNFTRERKARLDIVSRGFSAPTRGERSAGCGCLVTKRFPGSNLFEMASPLCLLVHVLVHVIGGLSCYIVQHTARTNHLISLLFKMSYAATCDLLRHYAICRNSDSKSAGLRPVGVQVPPNCAQCKRVRYKSASHQPRGLDSWCFETACGNFVIRRDRPQLSASNVSRASC